MPSRNLCLAMAWFNLTGSCGRGSLETGGENLSRSLVEHVFESPFDDGVEGQMAGFRASDLQRMAEVFILLLVSLASADAASSPEFFTGDELDEDPPEWPGPSLTAAIGTESVEMVAMGGLVCCFCIRGGGWSVVYTGTPLKWSSRDSSQSESR